MTRQDQIDIEKLFAPYYKRLMFLMMGGVSVIVAAAFYAGQTVNRANAALQDVLELKAVVRSIAEQQAITSNDIAWIKHQMQRGGR